MSLIETIGVFKTRLAKITFPHRNFSFYRKCNSQTEEIYSFICRIENIITDRRHEKQTGNTAGKVVKITVNKHGCINVLKKAA